jgi:mannose-6-phosphate isomerase-like protein (cupin superfamily)
MRIWEKAAIAAVAAGMVALPALTSPTLAQDAKASAWFAWSPKPDVLPSYGKNKPVTRLSEVLASHKGEKSWSEQVILTPRFDTRWIQAAPGEKTRTQYWSDDRIMWVVWGGQIRFNIEGQKPFTATKGFLVEVPQRVRYSMETLGSEPSLRFEVTRTGQLPNYPADNGEAKPADVKGFHYIKVSTPTQPDKYDAINRPYVDYFKDVIARDPVKGPKQTLVMSDEGVMSNIIRGAGVPTPPATNKGHFHLFNEEFWFILEGKCDYLIEGKGLMTADAGDVVFVPPGRWHRASWANGQTDTRLSFNTFPNLFHNFDANAGGQQ